MIARTSWYFGNFPPHSWLNNKSTNPSHSTTWAVDSLPLIDPSSLPGQADSQADFTAPRAFRYVSACPAVRVLKPRSPSGWRSLWVRAAFINGSSSVSNVHNLCKLMKRNGSEMSINARAVRIGWDMICCLVGPLWDMICCWVPFCHLMNTAVSIMFINRPTG